MPDLPVDDIDDGGGEWRFQLFVAGQSPQSQQAVADLDNIVEYCGKVTQITVIDLFDNPDLAIEKDILAIPTLIRESPLPMFRIIGDLSDKKRIWALLIVEPSEY